MLDTEKLIAKVDALTPNQYSKDQKLNWISQLDHKIDIELRKTHMIPEDEELKNPYEDDLYTYWLQAMIALQNAEIAKYNQQISMFNNTYGQFEALVNRTYYPVQPKPGNRYIF